MLAVTQLMGSELVEFGRSQYFVKISESAAPGPLLQLTAKVAQQGNMVI